MPELFTAACPHAPAPAPCCPHGQAVRGEQRAVCPDVPLGSGHHPWSERLWNPIFRPLLGLRLGSFCNFPEAGASAGSPAGSSRLLGRRARLLREAAVSGCRPLTGHRAPSHGARDLALGQEGAAALLGSQGRTRLWVRGPPLPPGRPRMGLVVVFSHKHQCGLLPGDISHVSQART